jgi:hypothetical protein
VTEHTDLAGVRAAIDDLELSVAEVPDEGPGGP